MIVVTGATGKLGRHVIESLLEKVPATQIVAAVRSLEKATALSQLGVEVREADYDKPESLATAFKGAEKVLLISSSAIGQRVAQHQAVVDASVAAKVKLLVYTSLLRADTSKLSLAAEHLATEKLIRASGLPYAILRNGWYQENRMMFLAYALQHGVFWGAAKDGKFAAAARADYAAAAATVLTTDGHANRIYELAGDEPYTLSDLAALVTKVAGSSVVYQDLPEDEFASALLRAGLPAPIATMLADSDAGAALGDLNSDSHDLSKLIGRPTSPLVEAIRTALQK